MLAAAARSALRNAHHVAFVRPRSKYIKGTSVSWSARSALHDHNQSPQNAPMMRPTPQARVEQHKTKASAFANPTADSQNHHHHQQQQPHVAPSPSLGWLVSTGVKALFIWMGGVVGLLLAFLKTGPRFFHRVDRRTLPIPSFVEGQTSGFIQANGVDLFYVRAGQGAGKKLMLCIHGFPECWYTWRHQLPEFSKEYDVVAFNMRGYGPSQAPRDVAAYSIDTLAADVVDLIKKLGHSSCILVAHDWGAAVAWTVARSHPEMVERLVSLSVPPPDKLTRTMIEDPQQAKKSSYMVLFQLPWLPEQLVAYNDFSGLTDIFTSRKSGVLNPSMRLTSADMEQFKKPFSFPGSLTASINYYRANLPAKRMLSMSNTRYADSRAAAVDPPACYSAPPVKMPVLQLWADNDVALEPSAFTNPEEWAEDITVVEMTTCSHWIPFDRPDEVNKVIWEFVRA